MEGLPSLNANISQYGECALMVLSNMRSCLKVCCFIFLFVSESEISTEQTEDEQNVVSKAVVRANRSNWREVSPSLH